MSATLGEPSNTAGLRCLDGVVGPKPTAESVRPCFVLSSSWLGDSEVEGGCVSRDGAEPPASTIVQESCATTMESLVMISLCLQS